MKDLKDWIPAVGAIIAGVFAIVSPFITWKLKNSSDERVRLTALDKERRDEIKQLYQELLTWMERAIVQVKNGESLEVVGHDLNKVSPKVQLLAPDDVVQQFFAVLSLLETWTKLHYKASPPRMKVAETHTTLLQGPDPTEQYKPVAITAHKTLQDALAKLIKRMRAELATVPSTKNLERSK